MAVFLTGELDVMAQPCDDNKLQDKLRLFLEVQAENEKQEARIRFTLVIQNISNEPVTLCFTSSKKYDFVISQSGSEIWRWSSGRMFAQVMLDQVIDSGKRIRFTEVWNYKGLSGRRLPAGEYDLTGILPLTPNLISPLAGILIPL